MHQYYIHLSGANILVFPKVWENLKYFPKPNYFQGLKTWIFYSNLDILPIPQNDKRKPERSPNAKPLSISSCPSVQNFRKFCNTKKNCLKRGQIFFVFIDFYRQLNFNVNCYIIKMIKLYHVVQPIFRKNFPKSGWLLGLEIY